MTIEIATALFLGMALQSVMNGVVNRGKPVQLGVRVKLPAGVTWEQLGSLNPSAIRGQRRGTSVTGAAGNPSGNLR